MEKKMSREKVLDMITKCFALGQSSNEHEARRAIAKAHELMAKYNIDQKEAEAKDETKYVRKPVNLSGKIRPWHQRLVQVIARYFMCKIVRIGSWGMNGRRKWSIDAFGSEMNIELFGKTLDYLLVVFNRLTKQYMKTIEKELDELKRLEKDIPSDALADLNSIFGRKPGASSYKRTKKMKKKSYLLGLTLGMGQALDDQVSKEKKMGLILVEDPGVEKFMNENCGPRKSGRNSRGVSLDNDAYSKGVKDGKRVKIEGGEERQGVVRQITAG